MKSPGGSSWPSEETQSPAATPQATPSAAPSTFRSILPQDPNQVAQLTDQPRMEGATTQPPALLSQPPAASSGADDEKMKLALMIARMQQSKDIGQQRNATMLGGDPSKNIGYTGG